MCIANKFIVKKSLRSTITSIGSGLSLKCTKMKRMRYGQRMGLVHFNDNPEPIDVRVIGGWSPLILFPAHQKGLSKLN